MYTFEKQIKKNIITQFFNKSVLQRKQQVSERIYTAKAIRGLTTAFRHSKISDPNQSLPNCRNNRL